MYTSILLQALPEMPSELFTKESLLTLVGLTGMVYVTSNSLQRAFNFNPKWLALLIAQVLAMISVYFAFEEFDLFNYFIGVFNGFLVYLTASGATTFGDSEQVEMEEETLRQISVPKNRTFTTRWW